MTMRPVLVMALIAYAALGSAGSVVRAQDQAVPAEEFAITRPTDPGPWQATNLAQGFRADFSDRGMRLVPSDPAGSPWDWGLALLRFGRPGELKPVLAAPLTPRANRGERARAGIVEWYINDERGIEHGFTLAAPPLSSVPGSDVFIELSLTGSLHPTFSADGQAIDFRAKGGAYALRYSHLKVEDAAGRELPARMEGFAEPGARGIRIRFDDAGAVYPVTVDPLTTTAAWTIESNVVNALMGASLQTAGDVNGDGYSDVIVAAPSFSGDQAGEGKVFVYLGSASGLATTPAWSSEGNQQSAGFGTSVATAGDVNGDGYDDVLVGAWNMDNGQADEGMAFLYLGSSSGLAGTPAWTKEGNAIGVGFGYVVATAGDVNGDGRDDVLVSQLFYSNGQGNEGAAFLYLGTASGLASTPAQTLEGNQVEAYFGSSLASAGDVNGDGYSDVIVGSPSYLDRGKAFVYLGSASGLATSPAWTGDIGQQGAGYGVSVATAGDVNADGYSDVIIGASSYDNGQDNEGGAFVYLGTGSASGLASTPIWTGESNQGPTPGFNDGTNYGSAVATAGDINGDGYADLMVAARNYDNPTKDEGVVFVYLGSATGPGNAPVLLLEGNQLNSNFGSAVSTAGDVNGDGYSDFLVGFMLFDNPETNEGRALLYLGAGSDAWASSLASVHEGNSNGANLGSSVASAGDVNGDGYSDVIAGAPNFSLDQVSEGRAEMYLGSATGLGTTAAWTVDGNQNGAGYGACVAGAGDVNGDGYSDVLVGAPGFDGLASGGGRADLYLGSASGLAPSPAWTKQGASVDLALGIWVAMAGDVNGDGFSDVVLTSNAPAAVDVYLGSAIGLATAPAWSASGFSASTAFNVTAASAGDVNRDGYGDLLIGSPGQDVSGLADVGRAFLYLGSPTGLGASPIWSAQGGYANAQLGGSVASAGDVNGDGYSDLLVSAPRYIVGDMLGGRLYLYLGSPSGPPVGPDWQAWADQDGDAFGYSAASAGDINADGYSDVIVGAPFGSDSVTVLQEGLATVFLGSPSGLDSTWRTASIDQDLSSFGRCVASAGDVNGDGVADVVVGVSAYDGLPWVDEGGVFTFLGNGTNGVHRIPRQRRSDGLAPVGLFGKSDSETAIRLAARGHSPGGRGKIRLEWEIKPLGTPFTGTGLGTTPLADTLTPGPSGSAISYSEIVSGLTEGARYHWRLRLAGDNPFFPRSPWISLAGNNVTETKFRTGGCVDSDADGNAAFDDPSCTGSILDCDDQNALSWAPPGTTSNLQFTTSTTLVWNPPASAGTTAAELRYDTLRGDVPTVFDVCIETNDGPNTTASDPAIPSSGQAYFYVTRARNGCPNGAGSLGTSSTGQERVGSSCQTCVPGTPGCGWVAGDMVTYVQGEWGDDPDTDPAAALLQARWDQVYASTFGVLEVGIPGLAGFSMRVTSYPSALTYLPSGGAAGPLTQDLLDPTSSVSGAFGGTVVALKLNTDFSDAGFLGGSAGLSFGNLSLCGVSGLPNMSVNQFLGIANTLLGGGSNGYNLLSIAVLTNEVNAAFFGGTPSQFAQDHLFNGTCPTACIPGIAGCGWVAGDMLTYDQPAWGANPDTDPAAALLQARWDQVYASTFGVLEVGIPGLAGFSMRVTSYPSALTYLPSGGAPGPLTNDLADPTSSVSGFFGGTVVALKLNTDFSDAGFLGGSAGIPFGSLNLCGVSGLPNMSVNQFLGIANTLLGGGSNGYNLLSIALLVNEVNAAFFGGTPSQFAQDHLFNGACP